MSAFIRRAPDGWFVIFPGVPRLWVLTREDAARVIDRQLALLVNGRLV